MLSYSDFQPYQSDKNTFKFKKLVPISESPGTYSQMFTKIVYQVTIFNNLHHFSILYSLYKKNIFQNISGFFRRKNNTFYCISTVNNFQSLSQFIEKYKGQQQLINQLFCLQLVQQILNLVKQMQSNGINIKILSPNYIIITEISQKRYKFKLKFPFAHDLFTNLSLLSAVDREKEFCAPEILILNLNEPLKDNIKFPKACLYSLGLVLLYNFGYRIKTQERITALKKSKQFEIFLKALRKEIKVFLEGKFISKIIKILLESNESVRDTLQTFLLKLKSPQLNSLRKFNYKSSLQSEKDVYIPTVFSENEEMKKSGLNKTIQIQGSSYNNKRSLETIEQNISYQTNLFASFKKSTENYCHLSIKEVEQEYIKDEIQQKQVSMPSPIEIDIDWDDDDNPIESSNRSNTKRGLIKQSNINKSKEKYLLSENSQNNSHILEQMRLSPHMKDQKSQQIQLVDHNMTFNIKRQTSDHNISVLNNLIQLQIKSQQPQIIKYDVDEYGLKLSKHAQKELNRKKSKSQLNDMKLVNQDEDEQQEQQQISISQDKTGNNIVKIKQELNKKSQAIFIVLLVTFLVYKIIDYFVKIDEKSKQ